MKKKLFILILCFLFSSVSWGESFISPIGFQNTDENRRKVISFIVTNVKETYSAVGIDDPATLRMMEKEELRCFKELTKVKDESFLRRIIRDYCAIGMCNYNTILMMYNEQKRASNSELEW